ncbi:hypothetical protein BX666DRAFT_2030893 [Dichotomocladium elegans]|nr:hypothetical protein BX666DRAFT_2030893 [Dichotomocladium elegans]
MGSPYQVDDDVARPRSAHSYASAAIPPPVSFNSMVVPEDEIAHLKNKRLREFYARQNEVIARFMEVDRIVEQLKGRPRSYGATPSPEHLSSDPRADEERSIGHIRPPISHVDSTTAPLLGDSISTNSGGGHPNSTPSLIQLAINASFAVNVLLFVLKLCLAVYSGSIAVLATAFESFLDLLSGGIIFVTMRIMRKVDWYSYPVGKARLEPLGIIIFSVVITTSFTQVLISSIERLTDTSKPINTIDLDALSLGILIFNVLIKALLWLWCRSVKGSTSVQALAQDHRNDVIFNTASMAFPVVASWAKMPWVDPAGAIGLSLYIIYEWMLLLLGSLIVYNRVEMRAITENDNCVVLTPLENIRRLTGLAASIDDLKQLTYMAYRFSKRIVAVDTEIGFWSR